MAISHERGGIAQLYLGGQLVSLGATANVMLGGPVREVAIGLSGVVGFTTKHEAPSVEVELFKTRELSLAAVRAIEDGTVQLNMNNGESYLLSGAFQIDTLTLDTAKGTYTAKFAGFSLREMPRRG